MISATQDRQQVNIGVNKMTRPMPDGKKRAHRAYDLRITQADAQLKQTHVDIEVNGGPLGKSNNDINNFFQAGSLSGGLSTRFTKGLPHDALGNADHIDADKFVQAINADQHSMGAADFNVPLGPKNAPGANPGSTHLSAETDFSLKHIKVPNAEGEIEEKEVNVRGWESPRAGHVYDLQGADAGAVGMAPAPALGSDELIAEMAEVYALALLRDFGFSKIQSADANGQGRGYSPQQVISAVASLSYFQSEPDINAATGRRLKARLNGEGSLTAQEIFRGSGPKAKDGPYISQFMLIGNQGSVRVGGAPAPRIEDGQIVYGSQRIDQKVSYYKSGADFMTTGSSWLDVQNGADVGALRYLAEANDSRFLCFPRDLAAYVHDDALYQAYLNAALILLGAGHSFDPGLPERNASGTRTAFATFGPPHILALVTEVSSRALKAVRRQKFNVHLRARPERIAAMITRYASDKTHGLSNAEITAYGAMHDALAETGLLEWVNQANVAAHAFWRSEGQDWLLEDHSDWVEDGKNYLLPMAFPEGSPMHPSYGAGHATVAGACVTILKALFEMFDGSGWDYVSLKKATGQKAIYQAGGTNGDSLGEIGGVEDLTLLGELDKLAANVSIGRNMAGVHFYSDYFDSVRMGERVAVQMLLDQMPTYGEDIQMRFISFDGDQITLCSSGGDAGMKILDSSGAHITPQEWRLRHLR